MADTKKFGLKGVGDDLQLGKAGPHVKTDIINSKVKIKFMSKDEVNLVNAQGLDPVENQDLTTKYYVDHKVDTIALEVGTGLQETNGGTLVAGVTISLKDTLTSGGTVGATTTVPVLGFNAQGQITSVSTASISSDWSAITSKPTDLSGYGIVDAVHIDGGSMTGALLLSGDPLLNLGAATKHYVDTSISDALVAAVFYDGVVDITKGPTTSPNAVTMPPTKGALYRVTTGGTADAGYTGIGGMQNIDIGDYIIWNGSSWDRVENTNPGVAQGTGITVVPTGDTSYTVSITDTLTSGGTVGATTTVPVLGFNAQGQITSVSTASISSDWSAITSKPTTLFGYGVIDTVLVGTGLEETNGGTLAAGVTISIKDTLTSGGTIGDTTAIPVLGFNAQGQITSVSSASVTASWNAVTDKPTSLSGYGINAGTGLIENDVGGITISINDTLTSGGTVGATTSVPILGFNAQGQITSVSSASISSDWSAITSKPTDLSGYGIVDGLSTSTILNVGTGLQETNGGTLSAGVTVSMKDTLASGGTIGSQTAIPVFGYNAQGQITSISSASINLGTGTLSVTGMQIQLATPTDGSLTAENPAVPLETTTTVTDAIDLLNETLGRLLPAQPTAFPGTSITLQNTTTRYLCSGTIPNNCGDTLPSAGAAVPRLNNGTTTLTTNSTTKVGSGDSGTITLYVNNTTQTSCGPFSLAGATTHAAPLSITNNNYYPVGGPNPGFWRSFDCVITGATASNLTIGYNCLEVVHTGSSSTTYGSAGSIGKQHCIIDSVSTNPVVATPVISEVTPGTLVYSSGVPHYNSGAVLGAQVSSITNLTGLTCLASGSTILQVAPANLNTTTFAYNQGGLNQFPFPVTYNNFTGWAGTPISFTLSSSNVHTSSTVTVSATNVNGTTTSSASSKTILYMNGTANLRESNIPCATQTGYTNPAIRIPSISATDYPNTINVGTITGGTTIFNSGTSVGGGDAANAYEAVVAGGTLSRNQTNYATNYLPIGPNYTTKNSTQYFTFAFQRNLTGHDINGQIGHFGITISGSGSPYSAMYIKPMVNKTAKYGDSSNDGTQLLIGYGYNNMLYNMDLAWLDPTGTGTTTDNGWFDASQFVPGGIATGNWPGQGEGINIPPYCGMSGNPSMGNLGTMYKITFGSIATYDCLNNLILVRLKLTGSGSITNISITNI